MMCEERGDRNQHAISKRPIHSWYMKHAFRDLRGPWRCISFATGKSKKKSAYQAQAETMNLQRASARAMSSRSNVTLPTLGCMESSQWVFRGLNSFYTKRKWRTKDHRVSRLMSKVRSVTLERVEDPVSSSSLAELIPSCAVDFDLGNITMSPDSEYHTSGEPPSRRSSDSFLTPQNCHSRSDSRSVPSVPACPQSSPFRQGKSHRRKRSIFRAAKVALTGGRGGNGAGIRRHVLPVFPITSGIGLGRSRYSLSSTSMKTQSTRMAEKQHPTSPAPARLQNHLSSRGTSIAMDTSSSPCKSSINTTGWMAKYDMLTSTETLSTSSWSLRTDLDSPPLAAKLHSPREGELGSPQEGFLESPRGRSAESLQGRDEDSARERDLDSPRESKLSSEEWTRILREDAKQDYWFDDCNLKPSSPVARAHSRIDIRKRQASAIKRVRHTGKDFQEAIVDIILDNDVNDLVDLEDFLQNYFRLNTLYQDLIEQFFNDLSEDLVYPKVSRAPSIFARLAAANQKSTAAVKGGGRSRELQTSPITPVSPRPVKFVSGELRHWS